MLLLLNGFVHRNLHWLTANPPGRLQNEVRILAMLNSQGFETVPLSHVLRQGLAGWKPKILQGSK